MAYPRVLSNLVNILRIRHGDNHPYNLLLTSYVSLPEEALQKISNASNWDQFCSNLRDISTTDRIAILKHYFDIEKKLSDYKPLALLIKSGYFRTIITANLDSNLEDALFEVGVHPGSISVLVVNRDNPEHILAALENRNNEIKIIKLRGSLKDNAIHESYPVFFEIPTAIRSALERFINGDIIVIGSLQREDDIRRALKQTGGSIYYVTQELPKKTDDIIRVIEARGGKPESYSISGQYGDVNNFFVALGKGLASEKKMIFSNRLNKTNDSYLPVELDKSDEYVSQKKENKDDTGRDRILDLIVKGVSIFLIVSAVLATLWGISIFVSNTPAFTPMYLLSLLVIVAAIILGAAGIINAKEIVSLIKIALFQNEDESNIDRIKKG